MATNSKGRGERADVAVIGAGIIGIAVAYYLVQDHGMRDVVLIDPRDPMSLTSAQSGENYRNWWPNRTMTEFIDHSIDLMEEIARETDNRINMTRRGYVLLTRRDRPSDLIDNLFASYGDEAGSLIRMHAAGNGRSYRPPLSPDWKAAPEGVDVLADPALIRRAFPDFAPDAATILHVRRAGSISGQQLGQFMLEKIRAAGGRLIRSEVTAIDAGNPFSLHLQTPEGPQELRADKIVNAAGPFAAKVQAMVGETLPISCVYQQKVSFEDTLGAIARTMPFTIDLDGQRVEWTDDERELLAGDPATSKLLEPMVGGIHCRPDGAESGKWVKLGWAFNDKATDPSADEPSDPHFPGIVLRAASRLHPRLRGYLGRLPRGAHHYGGYYPMTPENLPLIGPAATEGVYLAAALSGFGTMAACATGSICAASITGDSLPSFAPMLSLSRYEDAATISAFLESSGQSLL